MIHVILIILKWIGIILLAILGLLILLLATVLFVPVKYHGRCKITTSLEDVKAGVTVSWLFHLISIKIIYEKKKCRKRIKIAWKKIGDQGEKYHEKKKPETKKNDASDQKQKTIVQTSEKNEKTTETVHENIQKVETKHEEKSPVVEETKFNEEKSPSMEETKCNEEKGNKSAQKTEKNTRKKTRKKITYTFQSFYDKIKLMAEKKEKISSFIENEIHQTALKKLKKYLFRFLKKCLPKHLKGWIRFGFDDPSYTGKVLAALAILYPYIGKDLNIEPDFQEPVLQGDVEIKGTFYCIHPVWFLLQLLLTKSIRSTYRDIKTFKL